MKRLPLKLEDIAARPNLLLAVAKAARGKQRKPEVAAWLTDLEPNLARLSANILQQRAPSGVQRRFTIHDPKTRIIAAACFADRVLHHAILNLAEARFEQALVPSSFACRPGMGVHAAVAAVQRHLQRHAWWVQVDVASYFSSICHQRLKALLARRFKGAEGLALMGRIIDAGAAPGAGRGLPIGALTSQHFANAYLDGADRFLLARPDVRAHVRYMDDIVWWCDSRAAAEQGLQALRQHLLADWGLQLKPQARIGRSHRGIRFCGFRVRPGVVLPSARKMQRFRAGAKALQAAVIAGDAAPAQAQRAHDVLASTLAHTQSVRLRQRVWAAAGGYSAAL